MTTTSTQLQGAAGVALIAGGVLLAAPTGGASLTAAYAGGAMVLGAGAQALMPKPALGRAAGGAGNTVGHSPTVPPERVVYGRCAIPGDPVWGRRSRDRRADNADREYVSVPYVLTRRRDLDALEGLWIADKFVPLEPNGDRVEYFPADELCPPAGNKYERFISVHFARGDGADARWDFMAGRRSDGDHRGDRSGGKWLEDTHRGTGVTWAGVTFRFDPDLWPNDIPRPLLFQVRGFRVFDPRTGLTAWSANPALCWRDLLTGVHGPRGGIATALVDSATLTAAANVCDEELTTKAGDEVSRYECHGYWDATEDVEGVEEQVLATMGGTRAKSGQSYLVFAAAARAPVMDLGPADVARRLGEAPRRPLDGLFNEIKSTFTRRDHGYAEAESVPYAPAAYRVEDGGRILVRESERRGVVYAEQAQRLDRIELEQHRRQATCSVLLKHRALLLRACDVVRYSDPALGWSLKKFWVAGWEPGPDGVRVDLAEYDDVVFAWQAAWERDEAGEGEDPEPESAIAPLLLDIPAFRYADTAPADHGFYAAFRATTAGAPVRPVRLWRSDDDEAEPQPLAFLPRPAVAGVAQGALAGGRVGVLNPAATLDVLLDQDWRLQPADAAGLDNLRNLFALFPASAPAQAELMQFRDAVRVGTRLWRLAGLRFGLFGTEDWTPLGHAAGSTFLVLGPEVVRVPDPPALLDRVRHYRLAYDGRDPSGAAVAFTNRGESLRPLPPEHARLLRHAASGDLVVSWRPRARGYAGWLDEDPQPDPGRLYRLRIWRDGAVARTEYVFGAESWRYPAAAQLDELGSLPAALDLGVAARRQGFGSGDESRAVVPVAGAF